MTVANENKSSHQQSTPMGDVDYQHLLSAAHEKQRQLLQEVSRKSLHDEEPYDLFLCLDRTITGSVA